MEQFDRENSASYVNQPARTEEAPAPAPVQPTQPQKPRKSKVPLVLTLLLILALVAAAALGWLWYQQSGRVSGLESDLSSTRTKVATLEASAAANAKLSDDNAVTMDTNNSDSDAAVKAALAYAKADINAANSKLTSQVMYIKDGFANVAVNPSEGVGGVGMILKRVGDQWVVVFSGQDNPPQEVISKYGIPKPVLMLAN